MAKRHLYNFNKMALFFLLFITALKIADLFPAFGALLKLHSSWEDMMTAVPAAIISEYVIQYIWGLE